MKNYISCSLFHILVLYIGQVSTMDEIIYRHFGVKLKELQREALQYLVDGDGDLLLNLPVGYGKSLIYQAFPFLVPHPSAAALVITPLNIIQNDQLASLKAR